MKRAHWESTWCPTTTDWAKTEASWCRASSRAAVSTRTAVSAFATASSRSTATTCSTCHSKCNCPPGILLRIFTNGLICRVQEIFRDSLRSPELRLRVVKYKHNLEQRRPPAPVFPNKAAPSPADVHGRRAHSEDRDSVNMVEGEEKGACAGHGSFSNCTRSNHCGDFND